MNIEKIEAHKWYSISDLSRLGREGYLPITSRETWTKLFKNGTIKHIRVGTSYKATGAEIMKGLYNEST